MGASQVLVKLNDLSFLILTGGKSSRFGSDKKDALLNGVSLFDHILKDIPNGCQIVVSGSAPNKTIASMIVIVDDALNMGPVAGIANCIQAISSEHVAIIATDTPFGIQIINWLVQFVDGSAEAYLPVDCDGFSQSLCAIYNVNALKTYLSNLISAKNQSMKSVVQGLKSNEYIVPVERSKFLIDIDTPEALYLALDAFNENPNE